MNFSAAKVNEETSSNCIIIIMIIFLLQFFPLKIKELGNKNICYFSQFFSFLFFLVLPHGFFFILKRLQ